MSNTTLSFDDDITEITEISEIDHNDATTKIALSDLKPNKHYSPLSHLKYKEYDTYKDAFPQLSKSFANSTFNLPNLELFLNKFRNVIQPNSAKNIIKKLILTLKMIKFQHSLFAMPFALASVFIATNGRPQFLSLIMIILAMITARNTAMTFNRIVDAKIDKENPRTKNREIPSGLLSVRYAISFCVLNSVLFILISSYFNKLTTYLSPVALIVICGYSLTKRFTHYTQFFLGLSLGIAPIAAWIAMSGNVSLTPIILGSAVLFWVFGFDIIYSTLDYEYDKSTGLKNMVVKLGISQSLLVSKFLHTLSIILIILIGYFQGYDFFYYIGAALMASLLIYEHSLIKPTNLSKVNMAFFTLNGYVSMAFFVFVLFEIYF